MKRLSIGAALLLAGSMISGTAYAENPPPAGPVIFSLDGQPIPHTYTNYTVNFTANAAVTNLAFALREDPAYFSLDNITLTTGGGPNLVTNGDFEAGPIGANQPNGWTYLNLYNAGAAGRVLSGCGIGGSNCYYDGAVGSYDTITQAINTSIGSLYTLNFWLTDNSSQVTASAMNNGNLSGINLVVYAGAAQVTAGGVPEPATWAMMLVGFGAIGGTLRRRQNVATRVRFA